jgi:hypothetical protein
MVGAACQVEVLQLNGRAEGGTADSPRWKIPK